MSFTKSIVFILLLTLSSQSFSFSLFSSEKEEEKKKPVGSVVPSSFSREAILGHILKGALETMHFSKKNLNDDLSEKAFKEFLERIDYGKQFLLKKDVDELEKYQEQLDDNMVSGNLTLLQATYKTLVQRYDMAEKYVTETLKKPLDLKTNEEFETDPEKRKYVETEEELKKRWLKILKLDVLSRYSDMLDEQNGVVKDKDKKKKKKKKKAVKKKTPKELEKAAREKVAKSYKRIFKRIRDKKKNDKLDEFYNSIAKVYDPHTLYLPPEEKEDFDIDMSGKLEGIGALLREETQYIKVERIIPGSASWKGKELEAEDVILKVGQGDSEPVDIVDMPLRDAVKLIRGKSGSEVRLTVKKPSGVVKVISIIRALVEIKDSYVKSSVIQMKGDNQKFGYIHIPKFYRDFNDRDGRNCTDDTRAALKKLKKSNVDGVILDLRNNGGGALDDARMISGLFFERGPVVQVKDHMGRVEVLKDYDPTIEYKKPVVVLLNKFSASASEIVAAALQDYGRAIIVGGEHSHGKGTVQAVINLNRNLPPIVRSSSDLGALKITIQKFYRVNGGSTQYKGVTPDIVLPDKYSYMESGEKHLDYSLPWSKIDSVSYKKWSKYSYDLDKLKEKSEKRVEKNNKFTKLSKSIKWFKDKKDKTVRTLNLDKYLSYTKEIRESSEKLKIEKKNENLLVSSTDKIKKGDKEAKETFDEFKEALQKDPYIEESIYILKDAISDIPKKEMAAL